MNDRGRAVAVDHALDVAAALFEHYQATGDLGALNAAITGLRVVAEQVPPGAAERAGVLNHLQVVLGAAYQRTGEPRLLVEAVDLAREVVAVLPAGHPRRPVMLSNLGSQLMALFDLDGTPAVLDEAVAVNREALAETPTGDAVRGTVLNNLGLVLRRTAVRTADVAVAAEAVQVARQAVASVAADHPKRAMYLSNLGAALRCAGELGGDRATLAEAVVVSRDAVAATPIGHPARAGRLATLAIELHTVFDLNDDLATLAEAARTGREAAVIMPVDHPDRRHVLDHLAHVLGLLADRTDELTVLVEAVEVTRELLAVTPSDAPERVERLTDLADRLWTLSERTGDSHVLQERVEVERALLAAIGGDESGRAPRTSRLGVSLVQLFDHTGDLAAISEAISLGRTALAHADRAQYPGIAHNLVQALVSSAVETADATTAAEAVALARQLAEAAEGDTKRAEGLYSLAMALKSCSPLLGDPASLSEAIRCAREAVAATPPDHRLSHVRSNGLAGALVQLFEHSGEHAVIREAVEVARDAVALARAAGRAATNAASITLTGALIRLFERTNDVSALTEAVDIARDASASCEGVLSRAVLLTNLAGGLLLLHRATGNEALVAEAVDVAREAVAVSPPGTASRHRATNNLLAALDRSFDETGEVGTLLEVVRLGREVAATPAAEQDRVTAAEYLGTALMALFRHRGDTAILTEARDCFARAAASSAAPVAMRVRLFRRLANAAMHAEAAGAALDAVEAAVELVPQLTPRALAHTDREHGVGIIAGLASQAAAIAVAAGEPARAVELLEQTRGLLLGQVLDDRGDLTELRRARPDLADEFESLRDQIAAADADSDPPLGAPARMPHRPPLELGERRRQLSERWAALVTRIRATPGFDAFLRPPPVDRLRAQAADGPIVMVHADSWGAGALILTGDTGTPVRVVPLPDLTARGAARQVERLRAAHAAAFGERAGRARGHRAVHDVLAWLWDVVCAPVLDSLGCTGEPRGRIRWCPAGVLAALPLHAAGHHLDRPETGAPRTVLDRAVSSYVVTVRALEHLRGQRDPLPSPSGSAVVVAMPATPRAPELPGAKAETAVLARLLDSPTVLAGAQATRESVGAALPHYRVAHFACHGLHVPDAPASSRLLLHDHAVAPFTVTAVAQLDLTGTELAYLSACSTTLGGDWLADEALHLTAAIHHAGYRHVIGTLWPISDAHATRITEEFYTRLTGNGAHPPRPELAADALADAIRCLRDDHPALPAVWAAHVHFGP